MKEKRISVLQTPTTEECTYLKEIKKSMGKLKEKGKVFSELGITRAAIEQFNLGYCSQGLFAGRLIVPIHDSNAHHGHRRRVTLVGYPSSLENSVQARPNVNLLTMLGEFSASILLLLQ